MASVGSPSARCASASPASTRGRSARTTRRSRAMVALSRRASRAAAACPSTRFASPRAAYAAIRDASLSSFSDLEATTAVFQTGSGTPASVLQQRPSELHPGEHLELTRFLRGALRRCDLAPGLREAAQKQEGLRAHVESADSRAVADELPAQRVSDPTSARTRSDHSSAARPSPAWKCP